MCYHWHFVIAASQIVAGVSDMASLTHLVLNTLVSSLSPVEEIIIVIEDVSRL